MALEFKCYLVSDVPLFFIAEAKPDQFITTVQEAVWGKLKDRGRDVSLITLCLHKTDIPFDPKDDLASRASQFLQEQKPEAFEMQQRVRSVFPGGPHTDDRIDILVTVAEGSSPGSLSLSTQHRLKQTELAIEDPMEPYTLPRKDVVAALFERAETYGLVLVRGTPASGKSTTAQLLAKHVQQTGRYHVVSLPCWPSPEVINGDTNSYLSTIGWPRSRNGKPSFLVLDEAQTSCDDGVFWGFHIKRLGIGSSARAVLFSSYGGSTYNPRPGLMITFVIPSTSRVSLQPRTSGEDDGIPAVGLLFSHDETSQLLDILCKKTQTAVRYDSTMVEKIHGLTSGHPGAIVGLHETLIVSSLYRELQVTPDPVCTSDILMGVVTAPGALDMFKESTAFGRGLPGDQDLQDPRNARFLRGLLCDKIILSDKLTAQEKDAAEACYRRGWIHLDEDGAYTFASPLHAWYTEAKLILRAETIIQDNNLQFRPQCTKDIFSPQFQPPPPQIPWSPAISR